MSILEVVVDAAAHSEHVVLIRCDIGAKLVERSKLECLKRWNANIEHTFKIE
jgi:hypothetical protein